MLDGRKTEKQIVDDFLTSFEFYEGAYGKTSKDTKMNKDDFMEYYSNISATIDNDEYFLAMLKSCWKLTVEEKKEATVPQPPAQPTIQPVAQQTTQPAVQQVAQPSKPEGNEQPIPIPVAKEEEKDIPPRVLTVEEAIVKRFRGAIIIRGIRGLLGIERQFKVYTKNNCLELDDFNKAVEDFRLRVDLNVLINLYSIGFKRVVCDIRQKQRKQSKL